MYEALFKIINRRRNSENDNITCVFEVTIVLGPPGLF